ncbi:unnamed protein product [Sympodiomycopsis kandeliae]
MLPILCLSLVWSAVIAAGLTAAAKEDTISVAVESFCVIAERILTGTASVTGLLLAFRSNSATTRWNGGAKAVASVQATLRSLLRILSASLLPAKNAATEQFIEEYLALLPCFSLALAHQLEGTQIQLDRSTASTDREKYSTLAELLPARFRRTFGRPRRATKFVSTPASHNAPEFVREYKLSQNIDNQADLSRRVKPVMDNQGRIYPTDLALDLLRELQTGLNEFHNGFESKELDGESDEQGPSLSGPQYAHCIGLLNTLSTHLTELERLRDVTIPATLSNHLRMLLHLQLILTPPALVRHLPSHQMAWLLPIPCVILTASIFGLHTLAERLAQPFGTTREKLPLRRWCADFVRDWKECVGRAEDGGEEPC